METTAVKSAKEVVLEKLKTLRIGQCMLVNAREVEDASKLQLEFAEVIEKATIPLVGLFNQSDNRFTNPNSARRGWITVSKEDFKNQTGIDLNKYELLPEQIKGKDVKLAYIGITDIKVQGKFPLHLQIREVFTPSQYQLENIETQAKQDGNGNYLLSEGKPIFSNVTIVGGKASHRFIEHDESSRVIPNVFEVVQDDIVEAEVVEKEEK